VAEPGQRHRQDARRTAPGLPDPDDRGPRQAAPARVRRGR
jgi:hypothetical protein